MLDTFSSLLDMRGTMPFVEIVLRVGEKRHSVRIDLKGRSCGGCSPVQQESARSESNRGRIALPNSEDSSVSLGQGCPVKISEVALDGLDSQCAERGSGTSFVSALLLYILRSEQVPHMVERGNQERYARDTIVSWRGSPVH